MMYTLGDLNFDCLWEFGQTDAALPKYGNSWFRIGGVAYNFYRAGMAASEPISVVARVGKDKIGDIIAAEFPSTEGHWISVDPCHPTGTILILWFPDSARSANRWFIQNVPNANQQFTVADIDRNAPRFEPGDILFVTGYSLFREPVGSACQHLLSIAEKANVRIVIDVLPHDLQTVAQPSTVRETLFSSRSRGLELCIAESDTWHYLLGLDAPATVTRDTLERLAKHTAKLSEFASVRYGFENCSQEAVLYRGHVLWNSSTGYDRLQPRERTAYGDTLTMALIQQLLLGTHAWTWQRDLSFTIPLSTLQILPAEARRGHVLDAGAGYGRAYEELLEMGFERITGLESSLSLVNEARRRYPHLEYPGIDTVQTNLLHFNSVGTVAETATMLGVLTGFQRNADIAELFRRLHSAISAGGHLLIADFEIGPEPLYQKRYEQFASLFPGKEYGTVISSNGGITRHFRTDEIAALLQPWFAVLKVQRFPVTTLSGNRASGFAMLCRRN